MSKFRYVSALERQLVSELVQQTLEENASAAVERGGPSTAQLRVAREPRTLPTSTDRWGTVTNPYAGVDPEVIVFSFDTAELTVWGMSLVEVAEHVSCWFLGATPFDEDHLGFFEDRGHGARMYKRLLTAPGVKLYADPWRGDHIHIELEGSAMRSISAGDLRTFLRGLKDKARRLTATRLDAAWDNCPFDPRTVFDAAKRGDIRCTCRRRRGWLRFMEADAGVVTEWDPEDDDVLCGDTTYIGRRGSDRMLRVYNGRGFTRTELELRGERATALLASVMAEDPDRWSVTALGHLLDFLTFCERGSDSNVTRAADVLLGWWGAFVGDAKRAGCRIRRVVRACLDAAKVEGERALRKVAKLEKVFGAKWIQKGLELVRERYAEADRTRVRVLRAAVAEVQAAVGPIVARSHQVSWKLFDEGGGVRMA